jgi:iron complex outermembrane receptor protein
MVGRSVLRAALGVVALTLPAFASSATAQQTGELRVRVTNTQAQPIEEADVRIVGLGRVTHIGPGEEAVFENVPAGTYLIEVESLRSGRGIERVEIAPDEITELTVEISLFFHGNDLVVSVGTEGRQSELFSPTNVIRGIDLRAAAQPTLGETLAGEPGVSSSYHGPGSSRPIIRGLGGDRVRILEGGVGTGDASNTSPDHAPSVESMTADRIEVIRGPATLLYGSSAIGGVVNVEDGRVPKELSAHPVTGIAIVRGSTAAKERNVAGRVDVSAGQIAIHASGTYRKTDDLRIPKAAFESEEEANDENGRLHNSAVENARLAAGISYVGENGFIGVSGSGYDSRYGIPGEHGHEDEEHEDGDHEDEEKHAEGDVGVDLKQRRFDLETGWRFGSSFLRGLRGRFGIADYRHFEVITLEGGGEEEIETEFYNNEWEGRLEAQHSFGGSSNGAVGIQVQDRDFRAIGEEAFVPPTNTTQFGAFLFEQVNPSESVGLQVGARYEAQKTDNTEAGVSREFNGFSTSLGAVISASETVSFVANAARSVKAPSAEELFSDGPHLATFTYERGDVDLRQEVGYSIDAGVRIDGSRVRGELSFFANSFDRFIHQQFTGEEEDGLPVAVWTQADALFTGFEAQADVELFHAGAGHFVLDLGVDYVRARLRADDEPLPRIPPLRFGGGFGYESTTWHGHFGVSRVDMQDRVAAFETSTAGYTMIDASVGYRLFSGRTVHDIVLSGTNLGDAVARNHASFLKDFAPMPGRDIRLTYQVGF